MKYQLFTYANDGCASRPGIAVADVLYDLYQVATLHKTWHPSFMSISDVVAAWDQAEPVLERLAARLGDAPDTNQSLAHTPGFRFMPPLSAPGVIYAAGANYRDHVEAMGRAFNMELCLDPRAEGIPPWHFIKGGRAVLSAHGQAVAFPPQAQRLDWEAELAVIIGRTASKVSEEDALDYVAGYSCANDFSARDSLVRDKVDASSPFRFDWIGHKVFGGACGFGPFLTPARHVGSPEDLDIKLWLNDELRQDSNTRNHLYTVAEQIAYLSRRVDLLPGDVILTGTPAGVGMESGTFLKRGDVVRVWIAGLGELQSAIQ